MNTIKLEMESIEQARARQLHNAYLDGGYELERQTMLFSRRDSFDCLLGPGKTFGVGTKCAPVRWTGKALLVSVADKGGTWYAWIHA